jgi:hypothetical protein
VNGTISKPPTPRLTRQFLVHLDAELIRRVKILAIDRNVTASRLVQEALVGFLAAAGSSPPDRTPGAIQ